MKTVTDVARKLGMTERNVRYLAARGHITGAQKVGRNWLFPDDVRVAPTRERNARTKIRPAANH
jgi:hypothetical protein